ncbi:hypothetical protein VNO78_00514 [Psophocarpus tetragonolobus]|uniref:Uncharacterized protein n=1 Tax=Psophocarpus tetragonolobus TaxID=3891 RepID=A0AAN9T0G6_PSOTE
MVTIPLTETCTAEILPESVIPLNPLLSVKSETDIKQLQWRGVEKRKLKGIVSVKRHLDTWRIQQGL